MFILNLVLKILGIVIRRFVNTHDFFSNLYCLRARETLGPPPLFMPNLQPPRRRSAPGDWKERANRTAQIEPWLNPDRAARQWHKEVRMRRLRYHHTRAPSVLSAPLSRAPASAVGRRLVSHLRRLGFVPPREGEPPDRTIPTRRPSDRKSVV